MRALPSMTQQPRSLPTCSAEFSMPFVVPCVHEAGQAFGQSVGNECKRAHCRKKHGDAESPWVSVKHWRCEPAFFAYFLCGGKESECRPAQGQRPRREAHRGRRRQAIKTKNQSVADPNRNRGRRRQATITKTKASQTRNRIADASNKAKNQSRRRPKSQMPAPRAKQNSVADIKTGNSKSERAGPKIEPAPAGYLVAIYIVTSKPKRISV
ncbi:hypothetical protein SAMN05192539_102447 [Paraburkholderia diazotrophica]|uniref:Uncharacterized protein n=1 Tax=Paraburkholderia diazotrophica TaxID=667676 RepID=A0A1H7CTU3_9BURK|nr:hypothetical protein SAMN05192539_102447 [Paraburkholderia diazotrophica]